MGWVIECEKGFRVCFGLGFRIVSLVWVTIRLTVVSWFGRLGLEYLRLLWSLCGVLDPYFESFRSKDLRGPKIGVRNGPR